MLRIVQQQQARLAQQGPRESQAQLVAATQRHAGAVADQRSVAILQGRGDRELRGRCR
jgi:hypothetical protein